MRENEMYLDILNFLMEQQYVDLSSWAEEILRKYQIPMSESQRSLLVNLKNRNLPEVLSIIKKECFTSKENDTLIHILENLEKNYHNIESQWKFVESLDKQDEFLNLILDKDIIVFKKQTEGKNLREDITSKNSFSTFIQNLKINSSNPQHIVFNGAHYSTLGLSSTDNLQAVFNNSLVKDELKTYNKYEKIIQFIDNLEIPLQTLFSQNQIGIIIFQNKIYLIKWVQYINEEQLISGDMGETTGVSVMDSFGIKIGVHLKQNFELGNLVVFKNRQDSVIEDRDENIVLEPLFHLDEELFSFKKRDKKQIHIYDLSKYEDCKLFVEQVNNRIEMGILLLSKGRKKFVKSNEDLDLYVKISLQKIDGMDSINQRINILRDLQNINKNPDNFPIINEKLEHNYILLLKEIFNLGNTNRLPDILKIVKRLDLFGENIGILLQTIVYLIDSCYVESNIILDSIEFLTKNWEINDSHYKMLEKPQISAITNIVIQMLSKGKYQDVLTYLNQYLRDHPKLGGYNILSLILEILIEIFRKKYQMQKITFSNVQYIQFFSNFSDMISQYHSNISNEEQESLKQDIEENFILLSRDVDFISFLNDKIHNFLAILQNFNPLYVSSKIVYNMIQGFIELVPLAVFHNMLPTLGTNFLMYLVNNINKPREILEFLTQFTKFFNKSSEKAKTNKDFFSKSSRMFINFKVLIGDLEIKKIFLLPFKREVKELLKNWYLLKNVPESDFEVHREIIETWIQFAELEDELSTMINVLSIKELIWACSNNDINKFKEKYKNLPYTVFENNVHELIEELTSFIQIEFTEINQLEIINEIFRIFHRDFDKFQLSKPEFQQIVVYYTKNIESTLLHIIEHGYGEKFKATIAEIMPNLLYFSKSSFNRILDQFKLIYKMELGEGERFNLRIEMMKELALLLEDFLKIYNNTWKEKRHFVQSDENLIPKKFLENYYKKIMTASYDIFQQAQKWLLIVSKNEFLTYDKAYQPMKNLFSSIISQFSSTREEQILKELEILSKNIFQNQTMLNENKKKYFKMMIKVLPEDLYPQFYPTFNKYLQFINELSDVEALYYTIQGIEHNRISALKKRLENLIDSYPHLFNIWFIYGNILALEENYIEAIKVYNQALEYEMNQPVSTRLYHNLMPPPAQEV